ncbi:uncharacterized protein MONBRDRAFT_24827 [Monosiga brevicollis MX1]|uniref:Mechanosensitive ion channel MscS domain-containing protein n=1 Tax=Monosiga brevicollis TaxID=81824 RepID=A9UXV1_MONBE|nr:uncharacterized protein MONBRDRAFT_24827 [Monosiga brevicollis MX1]EDQ89750.1 predicted protein [Monosiga brevicollis MX1]|eukprot:XP_001745172.1 hypothetical protein [Monosiga brevicollis MX1]
MARDRRHTNLHQPIIESFQFSHHNSPLRDAFPPDAREKPGCRHSQINPESTMDVSGDGLEIPLRPKDVQLDNVVIDSANDDGVGRHLHGGGDGPDNEDNVSEAGDDSPTHRLRQGLARFGALLAKHSFFVLLLAIALGLTLYYGQGNERDVTFEGAGAGTWSGFALIVIVLWPVCRLLVWLSVLLAGKCLLKYSIHFVLERSQKALAYFLWALLATVAWHVVFYEINLLAGTQSDGSSTHRNRMSYILRALIINVAIAILLVLKRLTVVRLKLQRRVADYLKRVNRAISAQVILDLLTANIRAKDFRKAHLDRVHRRVVNLLQANSTTRLPRRGAVNSEHAAARLQSKLREIMDARRAIQISQSKHSRANSRTVAFSEVEGPDNAIISPTQESNTSGTGGILRRRRMQPLSTISTDGSRTPDRSGLQTPKDSDSPTSVTPQPNPSIATSKAPTRRFAYAMLPTTNEVYDHTNQTENAFEALFEEPEVDDLRQFLKDTDTIQKDPIIVCRGDVKLVKKDDAVQLGHCIFNHYCQLNQKRELHVPITRLARAFKGQKETLQHEMFQIVRRIFDPNDVGSLDRQWVINRCLRLFTERRHLAQSLSDLDSLIRSLNTFLNAGVCLLTLILILIIYSQGVLADFVVSVSAVLLAFSFLFSDISRVTINSFLFTFLRHPYDVGDRVVVRPDPNELLVMRINLLTTTFYHWNGKHVTWPNHQLFDSVIENMRRPKWHIGLHVFYVPISTPVKHMDELEKAFFAHIRTKPNEFDSQLSHVQIYGIEDMFRIKLVFHTVQRTSWQNAEYLWRATAVFKVIKARAEELGIRFSALEQPVSVRYENMATPPTDTSNHGAKLVSEKQHSIVFLALDVVSHSFLHKFGVLDKAKASMDWLGASFVHKLPKPKPTKYVNDMCKRARQSDTTP